MTTPQEEAVFDVCIIGSGFAGAILAAELASTGKRIAVLEAGGYLDRAEQQRRMAAAGTQLYLMDNPPHLHVPVSTDSNINWEFKYTRKVGGNSLHWGGWTPRPFANHFQQRSLYGVGEDWPLSYAELEPYLGAAETELGVSGDSNVPHEPQRSSPYPLEPFPIDYAGQKFAAACKQLGLTTTPIPVARPTRPYRQQAQCCISAQCFTCPTRAKYSADFTHMATALKSPNVTLLQDTIAYRLELNENGKVHRVHCHRPDRTSRVIQAGLFVLACNTLESTRLLLHSQQAGHPNGLANSSGLVGKYLTDHPSSTAIAMHSSPVMAYRNWPTIYSRHHEDGPHRKQHAGFRLTIGFGAPATATAIQLIDQGLFGRQFKQTFRSAMAAQIGFINDIEMLPEASNRVELDPEHRDHFGVPGLKVTFKLGEYERQVEKPTAKVLQEISQVMGCTEPMTVVNWAAGDHPMGTLRMGKDPRSSVVTPELKAHELPNLYVASMAVFPNSLGPTNPTLTLVALTLRLARHLRTVIGS